MSSADRRPFPDRIELLEAPQPARTMHRYDSDDSAPLITRRLPVSADAPAIARETLTHVSDALGSDLLRDAQLLVSEVVSYQVRRPQAQREGSLRLDVEVSGVGVRVQVVDDDRGSSPQPHPPDGLAIAWELQIVAQIADRWGIRRNDLTTVWFELDR